MPEKDIVEKTLESYNDVFADIVNGLLFNGEKVVGEDELEDLSPISQFKIRDRIHQQERDVSKLWKKEGVKFCLYGFENQTKIDYAMPLRIMGYDGSNYKSQIVEKDGRLKKHTPVVTLILYFGERRWKNRNLHSALEFPEKLRDYISDYKINVFEIAWLEPEQVDLFKSDFKIVADYFVQKRIKKDYIPSKDTIRHVDEILKMMTVLAGDRSYEQAQQEYHKTKPKGGLTMEGLLTKWRNDGYNQGLAQGISQGISQGVSKGLSQGVLQGKKEKARETAYNLLKLNLLSKDQIAQVTGLSVEEIDNLASNKQTVN